MSNFLQLRRPTTYSKVLETVPKPERALPRHGGLPLWEKLTLDRKLPSNACPIHPPTFSRGFLGQPLWDNKPIDFGFDLTDPHGRSVSHAYQPLHDKQLADFYRGSEIRNILKQQQLITDENDAICTLEEFNRYRFYLWKLHKHEIRKEFQKLDKIRWEEYRDKKAVLHIKKHYDIEDKYERKRCRARILREAKRTKALKAISKYQKKMKRFMECRNAFKLSNLNEGHLRMLQVRYNNALLKASRKSYRLRLKRKLRDQDSLRTRRLSVMKKRIRESIKITKKERHKMLFMSAQRAEANRLALLQSFIKHKHNNVERRMIRSAKLQERSERQLTSRKARNLASKYDRRSRPAMMRAMLKAWHNVRIRQPDLSRQLSRASVEQAVNIAYSIHTTISPNISSTQIIDTARQLISDFANMPQEQLPLDQYTIRYTSEALLKILEQTKEQVIRAGCYLIEQVATKMRNRIESDEQQRHSTLCGPWNARWKRSSLSSRSTSHRVSIGNVQIVDEIETDQEHFKKSRLRPPTPVTSITSLVEHIVETDETILESSSETLEVPSFVAVAIERRATAGDHPLIHLTFRQKRFLEMNLIKFKAIILRNVETRSLAAIDVMRLEIVRRKLRCPSEATTKESIARETARCILVFPKEDKKYAELLLDTINLLVCEVCDELEDILNAP
ncbi:fibrous sheath-interacting protein 2 [Armigeres subalbatus]|uniref:fibrous sheath-interacting protein 2 n=1 Tax=Armigeres subalbatus TaxID=124917 RepID=UPI002ED3F997